MKIAAIGTCMQCGGSGVHNCEACKDGCAECSHCYGQGFSVCDHCGSELNCEECHGDGGADCDACCGVGIVECENCGGSGEVEKTKKDIIVEIIGEVEYALRDHLTAKESKQMVKLLNEGVTKLMFKAVDPPKKKTKTEKTKTVNKKPCTESDQFSDLDI